MPQPRIPWTRLAAEFVVIVVGVLVALAADAWWQRRAERAMGEEYRLRLAIDLEADTANWRLGTREGTAKVEALDDAEAWLRSPQWDQASVDAALADFVIGTRYSYGENLEASRSALDELISTGRLPLIEDPVLRRRLLDYYQTVDNQRERVVSRRTEFGARIYEIIPRDPEFRVRGDLSPDARRDMAGRLVDAGLGGLLTAERNRGRLRLQIYELLTAEADSLIRALSDSR